MDHTQKKVFVSMMSLFFDVCGTVLRKHLIAAISRLKLADDGLYETNYASDDKEPASRAISMHCMR